MAESKLENISYANISRLYDQVGNEAYEDTLVGGHYRIYFNAPFAELRHMNYDDKGPRPGNAFKIHLSVQEGKPFEEEVNLNIARAWKTICDVLTEYDVLMMKVILPQYAPMSFNQRGKQITIYCYEMKNESGQYLTDEELQACWPEIVVKLDNVLLSAGVIPCCPAENEAPVGNSIFMTYAQDTNDIGKEITVENRGIPNCPLLRNIKITHESPLPKRTSKIELVNTCTLRILDNAEELFNSLENKCDQYGVFTKEMEEHIPEQKKRDSSDLLEVNKKEKDEKKPFDIKLKESAISEESISMSYSDESSDEVLSKKEHEDDPLKNRIKNVLISGIKTLKGSLKEIEISRKDIASIRLTITSKIDKTLQLLNKTTETLENCHHQLKSLDSLMARLSKKYNDITKLAGNTESRYDYTSKISETAGEETHNTEQTFKSQ